jgi:hypothetical protein
MSESKAIRIVGVKPAGEYKLALRWENGRELTADLKEVVSKLKGLRELRDVKVFARAKVGEGGHSIEWPGEIDIGVTRLLEIAFEQNGRAGTAEFIRWRWRHGLSLQAAADELDISRRQVAYYASGEQEVPRTILLALKGWEVERRGAAA